MTGDPLSVFSPEFVAALRALVREELALAEHSVNGHAPWLTVEEVAAALHTSPAAIHTRLGNGFMRHARIKEGRRILIERAALLAYLNEKKKR